MKKILASVAAAALAVSTMAVTSFAADPVDITSVELTINVVGTGTYDVSTVLVVQDGETWANQKSAEVKITGAGEYSYTLSGISTTNTENIKVIYIKDATCVDEDPADDYASDISDITIEYKSLKINGKEIAIAEGAPTEMDGDIFDFCVYNVWAESFVDLSEVEPAGSAPATTEKEEETTTGANGGTDGDDGEDKGTPDSGIEGVAVVAGLAIVAAGAVVVAKKRK